MKPLARMVALLAAAAALESHADCEQPPLVMLPAADEAEADLEAARERTEAYFEDMRRYVECLREELDAAGEDASSLFRNVMIQRNNLAVAEAEAVQRWFTARVDAAAAEAGQRRQPGDSGGQN